MTPRVTGIGGFFFRARDPEALNRWYGEHFGIVMTESRSYEDPGWFQDRGETVFSAIAADSQMPGAPDKSWVINLRVDDLDAIVERLRGAGVAVEPHAEEYPNGRFAELEDPEGNRVQLWEPNAASVARDPGPSAGEAAANVPDRRNPFTSSAAGGRALSAMQLPLFAVRPPRGYAVLTTIGRTTGKARRRCIRAIPDGDRVYLVAIKGLARTGWAKNALRGPEVRLRLPGANRRGTARRPRDADETRRAREVYCAAVHGFDYLTWLNWKHGRPSRARISSMLEQWFDRGEPVIVELEEGR